MRKSLSLRLFVPLFGASVTAQAKPDVSGYSVLANAREGTVTRIALLMLIVFASSPLARGQVAGAAPCKYEEHCDCAAPGITVRWKAAYCMALNETDDFEQGAVQRCLARSDTEAVRKMRPCQQNAYWKAMICGVVREKKEVQACIRDRTFIPSIVEHGAGSR